MLSDSIFDNTTKLLKEIAWYVKNQDTYEYDQDQIEEVMKAIARLRAIGVDYDVGGSGVPGDDSNLDPQPEIELNTFTDWVHGNVWEELIEMVNEANDE